MNSSASSNTNTTLGVKVKLLFLFRNIRSIISAQKYLATSASGRLITNNLGESESSFSISFTSSVVSYMVLSAMEQLE